MAAARRCVDIVMMLMAMVMIPTPAMHPGAAVKPRPGIVFRTVIHSVGFSVYSNAAGTSRHTGHGRGRQRNCEERRFHGVEVDFRVFAVSISNTPNTQPSGSAMTATWPPCLDSCGLINTVPPSFAALVAVACASATQKKRSQSLLPPSQGGEDEMPARANSPLAKIKCEPSVCAGSGEDWYCSVLL